MQENSRSEQHQNIDNTDIFLRWPEWKPELTLINDKLIILEASSSSIVWYFFQCPEIYWRRGRKVIKHFRNTDIIIYIVFEKGDRDTRYIQYKETGIGCERIKLVCWWN